MHPSVATTGSFHRRLGLPRRLRLRAVLLPPGLVGLSLLVSACGGSPGSQVARLGSTTTNISNTNSQPAVPARQRGAVAFSRCIRSHGVPNFPDPDSNGSLPAGAKQIARDNPRFQPAQAACHDLLPNSALPTGRPSQPELRKLEGDALRFSRCMRAHGVPTWPDYTIRGGIPIFDLHQTSIDPNSTQIVASQASCQSLLHLSSSPPTSGGA